MITLAEIEFAAASLPRPQQAELLRFIATQLRETTPAEKLRTGAELANLWPSLAHLSKDEAAAFEHDIASISAGNSPQTAPAWE